MGFHKPIKRTIPERDVKNINAVNSLEQINQSNFVSRISEIESIKNCFDSVLEGKSSILLVTGVAGIGKTTLVKYVVKEQLPNKVTYFYGKYRKHNQTPFVGIAQILEHIIKHLLTLPNKQLNTIKSELIKSLGSDTAIVSAISPYATKLFGDQKHISLGDLDKLKSRVKKCIYKFIAVASETLFPIIIFLDDLQWADEPSLEVLEHVCKEIDLLNVMLIFAYRDNEENSKYINHKFLNGFQTKSETISLQLKELTVGDIQELLALNFGENINDIEYFARVTYALSLGNPFYLKEIINTFIEKEILVYVKQNKKWVVRINQISDLKFPTDLGQIIIDKIQKIDNDDKSILEVIACFDGNSKYSILKKVIDKESQLLINQLDRLCDMAFLIKSSNHKPENVKYYFVHDIVLELIYKGMSNERKTGVHYQIAKILLMDSDTNSENNRLFMASQTLRCEFSRMTNEYTDMWIEQLFLAGIEAKRTTAIKQALEIFELCIKLLTYSKTEENLLLNIMMEYGECLFIVNNYHEAKEVFEDLIAKHKDVEKLVKIKRKYINLYGYATNFEKVLELGSEILSHLDFKFNPKLSSIDLIKGKILFSENRINSLTSATPINDERIMIILETLTKMVPAANSIDEKLFKAILIKIGNISAEYGNSPFSALGYAAYSFMFFIVWNDYKKGKQLLNVTLDLINNGSESSTKSIVNSFIGTFINHLIKPLDDSLIYLEKSIEESSKIEEYLYSSYSFISIVYIKYLNGMPIREVANYAKSHLKHMKGLGEEFLIFLEHIFINYLTFLETGVLTKESRSLESRGDLLDNTKGLIYHGFELQRNFVVGNIECAYQLANIVTAKLHLLKGHLIYADLLFINALTRISQHDYLHGAEKSKNKKLIIKYKNELINCIKFNKENHNARYLLVEAEYDVLFNHGKKCEKLYYEAISFAESSNQLQLVALSNHLAAKHYKYNKKLASFYAKEAVSYFRKWGAILVAKLVEQEFELDNDAQLRSKRADNEFIGMTTFNESGNRKVDKILLNHLSAIESMEEKDAICYSLNVLVDKKYIDYAAILFEKSDEMFLQYEIKKPQKSIRNQELINIKHVSNLSRKIVRYVARTGEEVVINNKSDQDVFTKDLYLMSKKEVSIICIPLNYLGVLVGIFYLEKNCYHGFDENILSIIKSVIPSIISKRKIIKDVNLHNIFHSTKVDSPLTDRELEVLKLAAEGKSNSTISKELHLSLGTVKNHLSNIYGKLEVESRIMAVVKANNLNLIKL